MRVKLISFSEVQDAQSCDMVNLRVSMEMLVPREDVDSIAYDVKKFVENGCEQQ